jgi:hypothetical protein
MAGAVPADRLPSETVLLIHVRVPQLVQSETWRALGAGDLKAPGQADPRWQRFVQTTGFRPDRDLQAVTVGLGKDLASGAPALWAIVEGRFEPEALQRFLLDEPDLSNERRGGLAVYTGSDETGQRLSLAVLDRGTVLLGTAADFDGLLASASGGSWMRGTGASGLGRLLDAGPPAPVALALEVSDHLRDTLRSNPLTAPLDGVQSVVLRFQLQAGLSLDLEAVCGQSEQAAAARAALESLLALGKLLAAGQPELAAALGGARPVHEGAAVKLSLALGLEELRRLSAELPADSAAAPDQASAAAAGTADASGASPGAARAADAAALQGLYSATTGRSRFNAISGRMEYRVSTEYYYFLPGGRYYRGLPAEGPKYFDFDRVCTQEPRRCGSYRVEGQRLRLEPIEGEPWSPMFARAGQNALSIAGTRYQRVETGGADLRLEGTWVNSSFVDTSSTAANTSGGVAGERSITFTAEGRFRSTEFVGTSQRTGDPDATLLGHTASSKSSDSGTYRISGGTLELNFENGEVQRQAFFCEGLEKGRPGLIVLGGVSFLLRE